MPRNSVLRPLRGAPVRPIVLVDDCPDARFLSSRALHRAGVSNPIVALEDGEAAIAYLRSTCLAAGGRRGTRPELMFLDIKMPRCDGFRVLRWVRRRKAFHKLRGIMLTHSDEPADIEQALKLGAEAVVTKYPTPAVLAKFFPPPRIMDVARPPPGKAARQRA